MNNFLGSTFLNYLACGRHSTHDRGYTLALNKALSSRSSQYNAEDRHKSSQKSIWSVQSGKCVQDARDLAQRLGGRVRIKLIIDTDIIATQPLTMGVIESISEVGKLKVKDISKCSGLDKREARKSSQPGQCKSKAMLYPLCFHHLVRGPERTLLPSSTPLKHLFCSDFYIGHQIIPKQSINSHRERTLHFF